VIGLLRRGRAFVPFLLFLASAAAGQIRDNPEDWASSPEAYFLTSEEKEEWHNLSSRDSRHDFIERYWLKRDPTPGTGKNQFRDTVLGRIKVADARFSIGKLAGSRTNRGKVFIVLGTPARTLENVNPADEQPRPRLPGERFTSLEAAPGNDANYIWTWDKERTPELLEAIGRPSLEIRINVEPSRRRDILQDPGLFEEVREKIARRSIVNPSLIAAAPESASPAPAAAAPPAAVLSPEVRLLLDAAAPPSGEGATGGLVLWKEAGPAEAHLWAFTRTPPGKARLHGLVRSADGREVASFSEAVKPSRAFSTLTPGYVAARSISLSPGSYTASLALTDGEAKVLASSTVPLEVPALEKSFAVSSLILTPGPADADPTMESTFVVGQTVVPPRADRAFSSGESLWYFVEVANPSDPKTVTFEPRLRRGSEPLAQLAPFAVRLQPVSASRFLAGIQMSLGGLEPGAYSLYLRVSDKAGTEALRRADFLLHR
jgi:GWxTD domain-containing protein